MPAPAPLRVTRRRRTDRDSCTPRPLPSPQERALSWVFKEYGASPAVPTGVLVEFLRHELQVRGRRDAERGQRGGRPKGGRATFGRDTLPSFKGGRATIGRNTLPTFD